jgi:hypothetical protein
LLRLLDGLRQHLLEPRGKFAILVHAVKLAEKRHRETVAVHGLAVGVPRNLNKVFRQDIFAGTHGTRREQEHEAQSNGGNNARVHGTEISGKP